MPRHESRNHRATWTSVHVPGIPWRGTRHDGAESGRTELQLSQQHCCVQSLRQEASGPRDMAECTSASFFHRKESFQMLRPGTATLSGGKIARFCCLFHGPWRRDSHLHTSERNPSLCCSLGAPCRPCHRVSDLAAEQCLKTSRNLCLNSHCGVQIAVRHAVFPVPRREEGWQMPDKGQRLTLDPGP